MKHRVTVTSFADAKDGEGPDLKGTEVLSILVDDLTEIPVRLAALYPPRKREHRRKTEGTA